MFLSDWHAFSCSYGQVAQQCNSPLHLYSHHDSEIKKQDNTNSQH